MRQTNSFGISQELEKERTVTDLSDELSNSMDVGLDEQLFAAFAKNHGSYAKLDCTLSGHFFSP